MEAVVNNLKLYEGKSMNVKKAKDVKVSDKSTERSRAIDLC